jgi:predicted membrane channel-forming protein YqfA (hemolysin III family)
MKQSVVIQGLSAAVIVVCMFASSCYHLFMPLSEWHYHLLLKIDLIGIGIMIFGLTLCAVYIGFHNYQVERDFILTGMSFMMAANLLI